MKIGSLFTGIGAFEEALKQLKINYDVTFACDNGEVYLKETFEELEEMAKGKNKEEFIQNLYLSNKKKNFVKMSYEKNFKASEWFYDVRFLDGKKYKNKIDLLVGGSPCQSFSHIGKRGGINDARGTLFFDYIRILKDSNPKFFIYENVLGIKTIDGGKTWERMLELFQEQGYDIKVLTLNAKDFNLPQSRNRVFVVGRRDGKKFGEIKHKKLNKTVFDYLEKDAPDNYFLGEKGFAFVTNEKYKNRARVNSPVMMCQKANQQFNWNGDFVFVKTDKFKNHERIHYGMFNGEMGSIRRLMPKETIKLMGFNNFKIDKNVPENELYRQSGNSIAVPVLKTIYEEVFQW